MGGKMMLLCEMKLKYIGYKENYTRLQGQGLMYMSGREILPIDE
jgi:hypothetical protein